MKPQNAFTLFEIIVALAIGGVCVSVVAQFTATMQTVFAHTERVESAHSTRMLAHRWIRSVLASAVAPIKKRQFVGERDQLAFQAAFRTGAHSFIVKSLTLRATPKGLMAITPDDSEVVWPGADSVIFEYLNARGFEAPFVRGWSSGVELPDAVRLSVWHRLNGAPDRADTILVPMRLIP